MKTIKKYFNHQIKKAVIVQSLITIESLDVSKTFSYPEEVHDFYEFVYVDSGSIFCNVEAQRYELKQGNFLLIAPKNKHNYQATENFSASMFIVCFRCNAEIISILDKVICLSKESKSLMLDIVREAKNAFCFPFKTKLKVLDSPLFGSQQLVESNIERLLIYLIRNEMKGNDNVKFVMNSVELENNLVQDLILTLKSNLDVKISLDNISKQAHYSKTFLNAIFKKNTGFTIMQYYNILKIEEAKKLLRENVSPTTISNQLNFDSPTYFTKVFKKYTDMTPSEYKKTIL